MTERIKEFAVEADLLIKKHNGDEFRYGNFDPRFQKFAELIVKECIDCLNPLSRNHSMVGAAQDIIREHFGVKE